jgi:hypothetical protein
MRAVAAAIVVVAALGSGAAADPGAGEACFPACRDGYVCDAGTCISACNPACGDGETCTGDGTCIARTPAVVPPPEPPHRQIIEVRTAPDPVRDEPPRENWARRAGALGIATMAGIGVMTLGVIAADSFEVGVPLGIAATVGAGVMIPIVARGADSARRPGASSSGIRTAGWVLYALTLSDAAVLIGLGLSEVEVAPGIVGSVGALGVTSAMLMTLDAYDAAADARRVTPYVTVNRDNDVFAGIGGTF